MNEGLKSCGKPSRGRYVQGCRCYMCRVANSEYALAHSHSENERRVYGYYSVYRLRNRVTKLLDNGWTKRGICREAQVPRSTLATLMNGHRNTPMKRDGEKKLTCKVSADFYNKVMALPLHPKKRADGELVDAAPVNAALDALYARGITPYSVAKESGIPLSTIYQMGEKKKCTYKTMKRLALASDRLRELVSA